MLIPPKLARTVGVTSLPRPGFTELKKTLSSGVMTTRLAFDRDWVCRSTGTSWAAGNPLVVRAVHVCTSHATSVPAATCCVIQLAAAAVFGGCPMGGADVAVAEGVAVAVAVGRAAALWLDLSRASLATGAR